ncbi:MAG TPA: hypothetical protein PLN54_04770 [Flavobacteriales bacterium]|nr:hypothetical protein [Flavobacteriales bacterium]
MRLLRPAVLALLATATIPHMHAQAGADKVKVKVRISSDDDAKAKLRPVGMVRSTPNHIMMMRSGEFDVRAFGTLKTTLDLYDRNKLTYVRSQEPGTMSSTGEEVKVDDLVYFGGRTMLIGHSITDRGVTAHYQVQDPALTKLTRRYEPLVTWNATVKERRPGMVTAGSALRTPFFTRISRDSSHMIISSPEIRDSGTKEAYYLVASISADMTVNWQRVVNVDVRASKSTIEDLAVDNNGNAYFVVKNDLEREETKGRKARHAIKLFVVTADGDQEATVDLPGDNFATSATLSHTDEDAVVCAGVYGAEEEKRNKKIGNFVTVFKAGSTEVVNTVVIPFTGTGLEGEADDEEDTKAEAKDKGRMDYNTDVIALIPRSDGSFFLVNEVFYIVIVTDAQTGRQTTKYVHGPVQVRCLEKDGSERWSTIFRRWVSSGSYIVGRVFCAEFEDQLFLFMLDSEEMAERRKAGDRITSRHIKNPYSAYVAFDDKGGFKIKPVLRSDKNEDYISGWELVRTGPNEYFALGTEKIFGGRFLPVKIEFSKETK